jgi:hypothetical protein
MNIIRERKKRHTVKTQFVIDNHEVISIKQIIRKDIDMTITSIKIIILLPKQVVNVFDLGYLGAEKYFPEQLSVLPY